MNVNEAIEIMHQYVQNENLRKHMYCVAEAMKAYAIKHGEDEEKWEVVGILHDFDWEILKEKGVPDDIRRAILSHADYTGVTRDSLLEKTLFAVDELSGFLVACALVQPLKKIEDVKLESVKKKIKKKEFARQVNREDIIKGAEVLGVPLDEHIEFCLNALKGIAEKIGL
jgi:predicted hydrolase (HD superfamily)